MALTINWPLDISIQQIAGGFLLICVAYVFFIAYRLNRHLILFEVVSKITTLPRMIYRWPSPAVFILGLSSASIFYYVFDKKAVVFASTLYAGLFFFNETIRTNFPLPSITNANEDIVDAEEYTVVPKDEGSSLIIQIEIGNNGFDTLENPSVEYDVISDSERVPEQKESATSGKTELPFSYYDHNSHNVAIEEDDTQTISLPIDIVPDLNEDQLKYYIPIEVRPNGRYRYLKDRTTITATYPNTEE